MNDAAVQAKVDVLLGCSRAAGPRRILGIGDGPVDSDMISSVLKARKRVLRDRSSEMEG